MLCIVPLQEQYQNISQIAKGNFVWTVLNFARSDTHVATDDLIGPPGEQVPSIPSSVTVASMNIGALTDSGNDEVETAIITMLGTCPKSTPDVLNFELGGDDFLPKPKTTADGNIGLNDDAGSKGLLVYDIHADDAYTRALQWEFGPFGRLGRRKNGAPNTGPLAGLAFYDYVDSH